MPLASDRVARASILKRGESFTPTQPATALPIVFLCVVFKFCFFRLVLRNGKKFLFFFFSNPNFFRLYLQRGLVRSSNISLVVYMYMYTVYICTMI